MEGNVKLPNKLVFNDDKNKNFNKFMQAFEIYLEAAALTEVSDARKIALLLNAAGEEALEVFNTFEIDNGNKKQYASVVNEFKIYCSQRESETFNRFRFFKRIKEEQETFDDFVKDLKILAQKCNFGDQLELLIRDRIVIEVQDLQLQEAMLTINNLSLGKAEKMCRAAEAAKKRAMHQPTSYCGEVMSTDKEYYECCKCDRRHKTGGECFAFGKECCKCSKLDRFRIGCTKCKNKKLRNESECPSSTTSDDEEVVLECKSELDLEISELAWYEKINDTGVSLTNTYDDHEDWWLENTQGFMSSDPLSTSNKCNKKSPASRDSSSENFCVSNTSRLSNVFSENSCLSNVIPLVEPAENILHKLLKSCNDGIELLQTYKQTGIVKRRKLVELIINEELKIDLNLRISKDRFLFLSDCICAIFPTECKTSYFIPAHRNKEGKPISAHGKLWDKYINQRVKYQKLKLIPKRKQSILSDGNESTQSIETDENKLIEDSLYYEMLNYLTISTCNREKIQNYWRKTSKRRLNDYNKEQTQVYDYFKNFLLLPNLMPMTW